MQWALYNPVLYIQKYSTNCFEIKIESTQLSFHINVNWLSKEWALKDVMTCMKN
jgi:hypothetical protein